MNRQTKLKDALLACICFTIIGLFNVGLYWEERSAVVEQITWELQNQLTLSRSQALSIKKINFEFYDEVTNLTGARYKKEKLNETIIKLIALKNKKIMKILNEDQQLKWLKTCSGASETTNLRGPDLY
ncbi:MAG: hypothetical protein C0490_05090 [Marivirga sp.]|nr:hypothetical protein [Marivirga sp.]